jgi:hypothetical protein
MDINADIVVVDHHRFTRVDAHANENGVTVGPVFGMECPLGIESRCNGVEGAIERNEEPVTKGVYLAAVVPREGCPQEPAMRGKHPCVVVTEPVKKLGRSLDVREKEGDLSGGKRDQAR